MSEQYKFSLESAQEAQKEDRLFDWAQEYLRGEGWNGEFANQIVERNPSIIELVEFPLMNLTRTMGPEPNIAYPEKMDIWENRVSILVKKIKEDVHLPPIIVTDFWKDLEIADGSHRHEAFLRCGKEKYWTLFLFMKKESKRFLTL
jgi:hypothetical protein